MTSANAEFPEIKCIDCHINQHMCKSCLGELRDNRIRDYNRHLMLRMEEIRKSVDSNAEFSKMVENVEKVKKDMKDKERPRRFVFTLNEPDDKSFDPSKWKHDIDIKNMVGIQYQLERGKVANRLHIQGYIEYKYPISSNCVVRDLKYKKAWVKKAYGSREDNIYTNKDDTYVEGGVKFSSWPVGQK